MWKGAVDDYIVAYRPIARQQLDKTPSRGDRCWVNSPLLGNGRVFREVRPEAM
jgi:hypothetical protein